MLIASALLIFGVFGLFIADISMSDRGQLGPLFEQMIHARLPWLFLLALWGGAALALGSLLRRRAWHRYTLVAVELGFAGLLSFYFLGISMLPAHALGVGVGQPFPSYSLPDSDGVTHSAQVSSVREPALYVFYRGDW